MIVSLLAEPSGGVQHISGLPPVAWAETPREAGELADESYLITWTDYDGPSLTGTVTVNWYYTDIMPRTFPRGLIPDSLMGEEVVTGIDEADRTTAYEWDTSSVAAGSYFIWSLIDEPPEEMAVLRVVAFARGVVTVAHPGDPIHPAIIFTRPDSPYFLADSEFAIRYQAFDPDGTGKVKIEASSSSVSDDFIILGENLPAVEDGVLLWDTSGLSEGDWTLRASLEDARGLSHSTYCRFFLRVQHISDSPDSGLGGMDSGDSDSSLRTLDSGLRRKEQVSGQENCRCNHLGTRTHGLGAAVLMILMLLMRARRTT